MASYRAYLEEGLDPSPQIYAPVPVAKTPAIIRPESASSDFPPTDNDIYSLQHPPIYPNNATLSVPTPQHFGSQGSLNLSLRAKDRKPSVNATVSATPNHALEFQRSPSLILRTNGRRRSTSTASVASRPLSLDHQTSISDLLPTFPDYCSEDYNPFNSPLSTSRSTLTFAEKPYESLYSCDTACQNSHSSARQKRRLQVRGIIHSAGEDSKHWLEAMELILQYHFQKPDILEEALESPGSGATCVGTSHRHLGSEGNAGLAGVGKRAMELVLRDECYFRKIEEKEAVKMIGKVLDWRNLLPVGEKSKLERFVRKRESAVKSHSQILKMLKEDVKTEDPSRTVARGVSAVLGAVYYDGGVENVAKVMGTLKIKILEK